jgi:uncharacterized membrane protein YqiK
MYDIAIPAFIGVLVIVAIGIVFTTLYRRSTRDEAYVRTGLGGQKVVLDGGSIVLPIFHSIAHVNLKTLRLEVKRSDKESMITKDRMRVDIGAEFYVRVRPNSESIALAAQTLGDLTNNADALRNQVEAKFVDGLRSVAATMDLQDLQEKRIDFVKHVQSAVGADIQSNGLELESVSLTKLDQTDIKFFNPDNFFDAHGLTALKQITEERKKARNAIVRDNEVAIAQKDLEARQQTLAIDLNKKEAELSQERDVANKTASTRAEVAQAEQSALLTEQSARIETEQQVAQKEAAAAKIKETAAIDSKMAVRQRTTEADRDVQIVSQDSAIAIANKSRQESEAKAQAKAAEALAVTADEKVTTARQVEIAERQRQTTVIAARMEAERKSTEITVAAEAEKNAAINQAEAIKTLATAEAEANTIKAKGIVDIGKAQAASTEMANEARNKLSTEIIEFDLAVERLRVIPKALEQAVKPIEKISDIRIFDSGGLLRNGNGDGNGHPGIGLGDGLAGQLLSVQALKPVIDKILSEAGFTPGHDVIATLTDAVTGRPGPHPQNAPATDGQALPAKPKS